MAAYVHGEIIWVIERRARVVWTREGQRGSKGRTKYEDHATEALARERFDAMIDERVRGGFVLVDAARSVDAPLHGKSGVAAKKTSVKKGLDVAELHATLAKPSCDTAGAWLDRFVEITATPCVWRLTRLSMSIAEDGSHVEMTAVFGKGRGSNPDAYEEDGYRVSLRAPALDRDDLEDGVDLDVFADELGRITQSKMVATFRAGVVDLAAFAVVRDVRVVSFEVTRID